jgi:hypothetical protein
LFLVKQNDVERIEENITVIFLPLLCRAEASLFGSVFRKDEDGTVRAVATSGSQERIGLHRQKPKVYMDLATRLR